MPLETAPWHFKIRTDFGKLELTWLNVYLFLDLRGFANILLPLRIGLVLMVSLWLRLSAGLAEKNTLNRVTKFPVAWLGETTCLTMVPLTSCEAEANPAVPDQECFASKILMAVHL